MYTLDACVVHASKAKAYMRNKRHYFLFQFLQPQYPTRLHPFYFLHSNSDLHARPITLPSYNLRSCGALALPPGSGSDIKPAPVSASIDAELDAVIVPIDCLG